MDIIKKLIFIFIKIYLFDRAGEGPRGRVREYLKQTLH